MRPTDWSIRLVSGDLVQRAQYSADDVQLHVTDHGVMVRTLYPTTETTYPWHQIARLEKTF
ncbi:hypothetical protein ACFV3R_25220 [Streptomyces sp. NPDC059740]|uniref:hypothetical protein n=1 Tax=Streptomyces sp. NPDC059740 TaxID=3346926 RepID=UPI0036502DCE